MSILTVGVDVSQKKLDVAIVCDSHKEPVNLKTFENTEKGHKKLAKKIYSEVQKMGLNQIRLIIEPTGGYELPLAKYTFSKEWIVCMVNPYKVRKWAESEGIRAKTDSLDARVLAEYGFLKDSLPTWSPLPDNVSELEQLVKRKEELEQSLRQEKNRLHALQAQQMDKGPAVDSLARTISWLEDEIKRLVKDIDKHIDQNPDMKKQRQQLMTTPGIGKVNSSVILVFMHRWRHITNGQGGKKALSAFIGLDPLPYESGTSVFRHRGISKKGDPYLRKQFYLAALGAIHGRSPLSDFYQRLLSRGKSKKLALIACARKILVWAWTIFSSDSLFDPSYCALS